MSRRRRQSRHGGIIPGVILITIGVVLLAERFDVISMRQVWQLWPLMVIWIGLMNLLRPSGRRSIFLLLMGIWLQSSTLELFGLGFDDSWPLLIIMVGASLAFDAVTSGGTRPPITPSDAAADTAPAADTEPAGEPAAEANDAN